MVGRGRKMKRRGRFAGVERSGSGCKSGKTEVGIRGEGRPEAELESMGQMFLVKY
jgi:hypothetical protein